MESFASEDEIGGLRKRMDELLTQFDPSESFSVFSTTNQVNSIVLMFFSDFSYLILMDNLILLCFFCSSTRRIITSLTALQKSPSSLKVSFNP